MLVSSSAAFQGFYKEGESELEQQGHDLALKQMLVLQMAIFTCYSTMPTLLMNVLSGTYIMTLVLLKEKEYFMEML